MSRRRHTAWQNVLFARLVAQVFNDCLMDTDTYFVRFRTFFSFFVPRFIIFRFSRWFKWKTIHDVMSSLTLPLTANVENERIEIGHEKHWYSHYSNVRRNSFELQHLNVDENHDHDRDKNERKSRKIVCQQKQRKIREEKSTILTRRTRAIILNRKTCVRRIIFPHLIVRILRLVHLPSSIVWTFLCGFRATPIIRSNAE